MRLLSRDDGRLEVKIRGWFPAILAGPGLVAVGLLFLLLAFGGSSSYRLECERVTAERIDCRYSSGGLFTGAEKAEVTVSGVLSGRIDATRPHKNWQYDLYLSTATGEQKLDRFDSSPDEQLEAFKRWRLQREGGPLSLRWRDSYLQITMMAVIGLAMIVLSPTELRKAGREVLIFDRAARKIRHERRHLRGVDRTEFTFSDLREVKATEATMYVRSNTTIRLRNREFVIPGAGSYRRIRTFLDG